MFPVLETSDFCGALSVPAIVLGCLSFTGSLDGAALLAVAALFPAFEVFCGGAAGCLSFMGSLGGTVETCCPGFIVACLSFAVSPGPMAGVPETALLGTLTSLDLALLGSAAGLSGVRLVAGGALGAAVFTAAGLFAALVLFGVCALALAVGALATGVSLGGLLGALWLAVNIKTSSRDPVTLQFASSSGAFPFRVICFRSSLVFPPT